MIEYFNSHLHAFWFAVGFILLGIELVALGFGTGFILFIGLSALTTGSLLWFNVISDSWLASITTFTICSIVISAILWKPFKNLQHKNIAPLKDNSSDLVGYTFRLNEDISISQLGSTRYSGIVWKVEIDDNSGQTAIPSGTKVEVTSVDTGKFRVKPQ